MDGIGVILALILSSLPCVYFLRFYGQWRKNAALINKLPGPKSYPLIGSTLDLLVSRENLFEALTKRVYDYGPVFRVWFGISPEIHFIKPYHLEEVLSSQKIINKAYFYEFLHPWLGLGLLTNKGTSWHSRRKLLTPSFHFSILENFMDIFVEKADILVNKRLKKLANGKVFNICPEITRCTLDIISKTAMGVDINSMFDKHSEYVSAVYEISEITTKRAVSIWLHPDIIFQNVSIGKKYAKCLDILHGFTNKVINDRKAFLKDNNNNILKNEDTDECLGKKKRVAFLDLLLQASESGANLSDNDIREEVDTFMFEGHDTTTASIFWTLFMLGHHPKIQDKVFKEHQTIFGKSSRSTTMADLSQMKYLEQVIKESLRLYPSVPFIMRHVNEDVKIGGYDVPAGTTIGINIREVHRDPEYFPNPTQFNPDNFLPEICKKRHPFSYIPFSAGPRNCIGQKFALMEEKTVLSAIIRKYKIKSVEKPENIKYYPELVLKSQTGIDMTMKPRK